MSESVHARHVRSIYAMAGQDPAVPQGIRTLERRLLHRKPHIDSEASAEAIASWYVRKFGVHVRVRDLAEAILVPAPALAIMYRLLGMTAEQIAFVLDAKIDLVRWRIRNVLPPCSSGPHQAVVAERRRKR